MTRQLVPIAATALRALIAAAGERAGTRFLKLPTRNINYGSGHTITPDIFVVDRAEERGHPHFY
jgi:hypothetical protein